jgi:cytochrome c-type biogenesis protein CcmH
MMNCLRNSLLLILLSLPLMAFQAEEKLPEPAKEAEAQKLFKQIRCVVCEGESLAESGAGMAHDMRGLIRKEIGAGKTPAQVKAQLVANYGERILQTPPVGVKTYFLWFMPFLMLIIGIAWLILKRPGKKA